MAAAASMCTQRSSLANHAAGGSESSYPARVMSDKCSPRRREVLDQGDVSGKRELQVMFRSDLAPEVENAALQEIARITGAAPHVSFGIASVNAPISAAARIAALDGVEWIDLASHARIEELLD